MLAYVLFVICFLTFQVGVNKFENKEYKKACIILYFFTLLVYLMYRG